jgi:hypothetical protein
MQPFHKQLRLSNHNTKLQKVMKRIIACLSLLITVISCESGVSEFTPDDMQGVYKSNVTYDFNLLLSCAANPYVSFGSNDNNNVKVEKMSGSEIKVISKNFTYDPKQEKVIESEIATTLTLKPHEDHLDLMYNGQVVGDYRVDKVYLNRQNPSFYQKGKVLNIRLEDIDNQRFVMFRGVRK